MKINIYLKDPSAKTETPIIFIIRYAGDRIKFNSGDLVLPLHWNSKKQRHKSSFTLNQKLDSWEIWIKEEYLKYQAEFKSYPNHNLFRERILSSLREIKSESEKKDTFMGYFKDLIKRSEDGLRQPYDKPVAPATIQVYTRTLQTLEEFSQSAGYKVDFDTLDHNFYGKFVEFLTNRNYTNNTIGKYLRFVKLVANDAGESGYQVHVFVKSKKFKVLKQEDTDHIYLTPEQIEEIIKLDLGSNLTLDRVRDLFVIQCKTALRYSDIQTLSEKNISGDFIRIATMKTNQKLHIPMVPEIRRILKKYHGKFPVPLSNPKANKYLKDLGQMIPSLKEKFTQTVIKGGTKRILNKMKWELLTTHPGRRSYCTNAYLAGVAIQDIMRVSGHKSEKTFRKYLRMDDLEHAKVISIRDSKVSKRHK